MFISTAAVADYRPARAAQQKIKKTSETLDLAMERTTDVLATVAARAERPSWWASPPRPRRWSRTRAPSS